MQGLTKQLQKHNQFLPTKQGTIGIALFLLDIGEIFPPNYLFTKNGRKVADSYGPPMIMFRIAVHCGLYYLWFRRLKRLFQPSEDSEDPNYNELNKLSTQQKIGIGLSLTGHVFYNYCKIYLGKMFTYEVGITSEHKLIQTGPYSFLRHPGYSGLLLYLFGDALYFNTVFSYITFLSYLNYLMNRITVEEACLIEEFGDTYHSYRNKSWRLIPFFY